MKKEGEWCKPCSATGFAPIRFGDNAASAAETLNGLVEEGMVIVGPPPPFSVISSKLAKHETNCVGTELDEFCCENLDKLEVGELSVVAKHDTNFGTGDSEALRENAVKLLESMVKDRAGSAGGGMSIDIGRGEKPASLEVRFLVVGGVNGSI